MFPCTECNQTFIMHKSLRSHVKLIHEHVSIPSLRSVHKKGVENKNMFTCAECKRTFTAHKNLRRHFKLKHNHISIPSLRSVPKEGVEHGKMFQCSECNQTFTFIKNLKRHFKLKHSHIKMPPLRSVHRKGVEHKNMFTCSECYQTFTNHGNLRRHFKLKHNHLSIPSLRSVPLQLFTCPICPKNFRSRNTLKQHLQRKHGQGRETAICAQEDVCPLKCLNLVIPKKKELVKHLIEHHNILIEENMINFPNFKEFVIWKSELEETSKSLFVIRRRRKASSFTLHNFECHRSGHFVSKSKGLRQMRKRGSNKINALCPAFITVKEYNVTGNCDIRYSNTHVGHDNDFTRHLRSRSPSPENSVDEMVTAVEMLERTPASSNEYSSGLMNTLGDTKEQLKKQVFEIIDNLSSEAEINFFQEFIAELKFKLSAMRKKIVISSGTSVYSEHPNRNVMPQRRLFSTKNSRTKCIKCQKLDGSMNKKISLLVLQKRAPMI